MNTITTTSETIYFVNVNPLIDVCHEGEISPGSTMRTGQPLTVYKNNLEELKDLVFLDYDESDEKNHDFFTIDFSTYTDYSAMETVINDLNSFDFIKASEIKHPNRDEWAVAVQEVIFSNFPDGEVKDRLTAAAILSVQEGRRKTIAELKADGWV